MDGEILELITHYLTENRINKVLEQDEEYKAAKLHEAEIHKKLISYLTDEQLLVFNDFIVAATETGANVERVHYQHYPNLYKIPTFRENA